MTRIIQPEKNRLEVADILRKHIGDYQNQYPLWPEHKKIVSDLLNCRTSHLGGHIDRCDNCGAVRIIYHSCRNRHCPKCQHMATGAFGLEKKKRRDFYPSNTSMSSLPCPMNSTPSS